MTKDRIKAFRRVVKNHKHKNTFIIIGVVVLIALLLLAAVALYGGNDYRSQKYKAVEGAAGLNATISYDCKDSCDNKFSFNVYIFNKSGRQVSVVQPDKDGKVRLALPEGEYVMLVGKQFGKSNTFPQEPLELKNGQSLELELKY